MTYQLISSSVLILAVLILRRAFGKKVNARGIYALWLCVAVKLCLPFSLFSVDAPEISALYGIKWRAPDYAGVSVEKPEASPSLPFDEPVDKATSETAPAGTYETTVSADSSASRGVTNTPQPSVGNVSSSRKINAADVLKTVLIIVPFAVGAVFAASAARFAILLRKDKRLVRKIGGIRVFETDAVSSPCVFGFRTIYIPRGGGYSFALRHEVGHIRHLDFLWNILRCLVCSVYWFDPLVWLAAAISGRDAELAADEFAVDGFSAKERVRYAEKLVDSLSAERNRRPAIPGCGFSSGGMKKRVTAIIDAKNDKRPMMIICLALAALMTAMSFASCSAAGKINADADVPDYVVKAAQRGINEFFDKENDRLSVISGGSNLLTGSRVERLSKTYSYKKFAGLDLDLDVYILDPDFRTNNMNLVDASRVFDDGWYRPGSEHWYLVFEGKKLLCFLTDADSSPGSIMFSVNLAKILSGDGIIKIEDTRFAVIDSLAKDYESVLRDEISETRKLNSELKSKEREIAELTTRLDELKKQLDELKAQINN